MDYFNLDLSCGVTYTFTIGPNLPQFTFKIIPEVRQSANGFPESTVQNIEVFRGNSSEPSQRLTGCDFSEMQPPPSRADPPWFHTEDINFDGFQDIYVMTSWGATGNQGGCVWVFDPVFDGGTGRFEYSDEFSALGSHRLESSTKTIFSIGVGGMAGTIYNANKFDIKDNRPVLVYTENQDYDNDKKQYHCVVQERQGDSMVTLLDRWAKDPDCDPDGLLRHYMVPKRIKVGGDVQARRLISPESTTVNGGNPKRIKVDGDVQARLLVTRVNPRLLPSAQQLRNADKTVLLRAFINEDGSVAFVDVIRGEPVLAKAAQEAVSQWRYKPTVVDNRQVEVETTITLTFP